jgi:hypothetical protein
VSVTIARCAAADIEPVVRFIDEQWKRGHVLATCRALLDWQYRNPDGSYSFILARRGDEIVGLLGYITTVRYDEGLTDAATVWLTTWKVRSDAHVAALGLSLLQHLDRIEPHAAIGAIGLNPQSRPMYAALGYRIGELDHYATSPGAPIGAAPLQATLLTDVEELDTLPIASVIGAVPRKTPRYFHRRYVAHPFYRYHVVVLRDHGQPLGLLAARVAEHEQLRALRIVDFLGAPEAFARAGAVVQTMMRDHGAAYADVYNTGIDAAAFAEAGFARVDPDGLTIVPDHFEPFENRNVRLWYAMRGAGKPVLFKGDSDQDRPNRVADGPR